MSQGLYIHIPFCHSKCYYCDFYSRPVGKSSISHYVDSVIREYGNRKQAYGNSPSWNTVYIGGGTPSLIPIDELNRLVSCVTQSSTPEEFTIEANPEDITPLWIENVLATGITRISMGVQSFDDNLLGNIGRRHSAEQSLKAIESLQSAGIEFSIDLIYGLPDQTLEDWERTLDILNVINPPHFSAYLLSYEPGTRLYLRREQGKVKETDEETAVRMYRALCDFSGENGYKHYEISNFAKPEHEGRHNSSYWKDIPYLGLGPGAHSYDGVQRSYNPPSLKDYSEALDNNRSPLIIEQEDYKEKFNDKLISALRTSGGLALSSVEHLPDSDRSEILSQIEKLKKRGKLTVDPTGNIIIPEHLWIVSDSIFRQLLLI